MRFWDAEENYKCTHILYGHKAEMVAVVFSPDGSLIASSCRDETIRVWDAHAAKCIRIIERDEDAISLSFSPNSEELLAANLHGVIELYDFMRGDIKLKFHVK